MKRTKCARPGVINSQWREDMSQWVAGFAAGMCYAVRLEPFAEPVGAGTCAALIGRPPALTVDQKLSLDQSARSVQPVLTSTSHDIPAADHQRLPQRSGLQNRTILSM
jgi:hypothetical protein